MAESLLGEVVLVPDLKSAVAPVAQNGVRVTLVTPEGDVIDPSGVITGGSDRPIEEEILARRREIERLRGALETASLQLSEVRAEQEQVALGMAEAEEAVKALGQGAHELTVRIVAAEKDVERLELERPQCLSRRDVVRYEIETLARRRVRSATRSASCALRATALGLRHQALEEAVTARRGETEDAVQRAEGLAAEVTAMKVRVAERRERQQATAAAVESLRPQQRELPERLASLEGEREGAARERDDAGRRYRRGAAREAEQTSAVRRSKTR